MEMEIAGTSVHYETFGSRSNPHVLLLHGWGCSAELMMPVAKALKDQFCITVIDFPGFGKSKRPPCPWGVPEYAMCVKELAQKVMNMPFSIVGHSFGCRVAVWLAANEPTMVRKLVLTGAAGLRAKPSEKNQKKSKQYQKFKKLVKKIENVRVFPGLHKKIAGRIRTVIINKYGSADYRALDEEMRNTFVKVINLDLRDMYKLISQPSLLIWGENDSETPLWMGMEIESLIPDAGLVTFEGATHFAYLEQSARFNTIVRTFLTEA